MFNVQHNLNSPEDHFGAAVGSHLEFQGLSQRKFAEMLTDKGMPVDASAVSRLLKGQRAMRLSELYVVADALGVPLINLLPVVANPKAELNTLRRSADISWQRMGESSARLVSQTQEIVRRLAENPELMTDLVNREGVQIESPAGYVEWVVGNTEGAFERRFNEGSFGVDDLAWVETEELKTHYLDMLRQLIAPFIAVGIHPDLREDAAWRKGPPEEMHGEHQAEA